MKKIFALLLIFVLTFSFLSSCIGGGDNTGDGGNDNTGDGGNDNTGDGGNDNTGDGGNDNTENSFMTYDEYMAAEIDSEVTIRGYVQATQGWWADEIIAYIQDRDGGYYIYKIRCTEAEAAKLTKGTKVEINGYKAEWGGEIEITDATFTLLDTDDKWIAEPTNATALLGTNELMKHQNKLVKYTDMTVKAIEYKNDAPGDDIYITFTKNGADYKFTVEVYLTGTESEVYKAVATLAVGDIVDVEGFLQSYEGKADTHITSLTEKSVDPYKKSEGVMTYAEYMAAEIDSEVTIEGFVQATQGWWGDEIIAYIQDGDGGYYVYKIGCTEAEAAKLTKGTKVQIKGYKAVWGGEIEITDATFTVVQTNDTWVAEATDVTALLGTAELVKHQNKLVKYTDMTVKAIEYKNDAPGDDIYITFTKNGVDYKLTVEVYLTGTESEVYLTAATLKVGDVVDVEGFLQSYEDKVDTHIVKITKAPVDPYKKSKGVMTYAEYMAAEIDSEVTIEGFVQATQGWWGDEIIAYIQDGDGGYYVYKIGCTEAEAAKLTKGTKVQIKGYKAEWGGEIEITDATFTVVQTNDTWVAEATDVTALLGTAELMKHQNKLVKYTDMTVKAIEYKNDAPGDDIYITFTKNGADYKFTVEVYLTGTESEVYKAVATLAVGDVVDVEGFLQSYEGNPDTHIVSITKK